MIKKRAKPGSAILRSSTNGSGLSALSIGRGGRPASAKDWFEAYNKRRNEEAWRLDEWKATVNNIQKRELQTKFFNNLSQSNRDRKDECKEIEEKEANLRMKRERLRELLATEERLYKEEKQKNLTREILKPGSVKYPEVQLLRAQLDELRKKNEDESKKLSEKLSYEMWRKNTPNVRQMESDRLNRFVRDAWMGQKEWKEEQLRKQEEDRRKYEIEEEDKRRLEMEECQKIEIREIKKLEDWKVQLNEQVNNLKIKQDEEYKLRLKEKVLSDENSRLETIIDRREEQIIKRNRKDLEAFWSRQFNLKLRKKSLSIQNDLVEDENLIEDLIRRKDSQYAEDDQQQSEAGWLKGVLNEQKKLEALRDKEYDRLFSEESEQMWNRRQNEWEREKIARDKLMKEVIEGRKKQLDDHIFKNKMEMSKNLDQRSYLISSIENMKSQIENVNKEKLNTVNENASQKNVCFIDPIKNAQKEKVRHRELLSDEEALATHRLELKRLEEEIDNLWQKSYIPPKHGRKKVAW